MPRSKRAEEPNYTVIALQGLFSNKQKTALDELPPKWLTATHQHQPGCSFGPSKRTTATNQHTQRLQNLRHRKIQKQSKFSWTKHKNNKSTPTLGSPHGPAHKKTLANPHIPFNSNTPKTCWFDTFSKVSEDEDPSLYHDQFHFHLRQLAKQGRLSSVDRDKASWLKASPYIDRSIERGLSWTKNDFVTEGVSTSEEQRALFMRQRPADSGRVNMAATTTKRPGDLQHAVMRSNTKRMVYREPLQSGLPPPQVAAGAPAMRVTRPQYQSIAFSPRKKIRWKRSEWLMSMSLI